jgi:ATP/maltotriose-dependent transcriptional regulator MalT
MRTATARDYALAARLAFEVHDDATALALYDEAVMVTGETAPSRRALIRSSQTMVAYYATGDVERARRIAAAAVRDARCGDSVLMRARAHALQAEMAARSAQHRHAQAALHLARHDLDADTTDDPMNGAFSRGRLRGFEGICGIFLGQAETAERQLTASVQGLTGSRHTVQRAIVLTDRALARLRTRDAGAPEAAAEQLHECVELTAATRGRVPAQRLRQARLELRPWRGEPFVADLDDHIHTALIGI